MRKPVSFTELTNDEKLHTAFQMFSHAVEVSREKLLQSRHFEESKKWRDIYLSNINMKFLTLHKICSRNR